MSCPQLPRFAWLRTRRSHVRAGPTTTFSFPPETSLRASFLVPHRPSLTVNLRVADRVAGCSRGRLRGTLAGRLLQGPCNLRRTALSHLFSQLDGKGSRNPVADVPKFEQPEPQPHALPADVIRATFEHMRPSATKARLMLMAYGGFRPSEIARAIPEDVEPFLDVPEPCCYKRVGKGGRPLTVPLPPEGVEAWRLLIARNAWGKFSRENINRDWKAAMIRASKSHVAQLRAAGANQAAIDVSVRAFSPVRCYSLRHSYATQLPMKGSDNLSLVQEALGHRDARTTRIYTTVKVNPRLVAAVRKAFAE